MNSQLRLIQAQCPAWATVRPTNAQLNIDARAIHPSGRADKEVSLRVSSARGRVYVREREPRQWAKGCPERHINRDGTFCLGVGDPIAPANAEDARDWWRWLKDFILSQRVADRSGLWPSTRALHHGDAYKHQLKLEELSADTRFEGEVRDALEHGCGWLAGEIPRLSKDGKRLVNLRAGCPRGCRRRGRPILRRNCDDKDLMFALIQQERMRRAEEKRFWAEYVGHPCCGSMRDCPLR